MDAVTDAPGLDIRLLGPPVVLVHGRPLEVDALVGAVVEIGRKVGVATPNIDALLGLTRLMAATRGLLPR